MTTNHPLIKYGLFCFITGTTIGFATVNNLTIAIIPYLRSVMLAIAALVLLIWASGFKINRRILLSFTLLIFMNLYGTIRGLDNLAYLNYLPDLVVSTIVVLTGLAYFGISESERSQLTVAIYLVIFAAVWFLLLVFTGGLNLTTMAFDFQVYSRDGRYILYSQGISKFYGFAAIVAIWVAQKVNHIGGKNTVYILSFVFISLSFLGGGRGDFLALIIVIVLMGFLSSLRGALFSLVIVFIVFFFFFEYVPKLSDNIIAAQRFVVILTGSTFGLRDILFNESLHIISNESNCFLFGCGFTYFQEYYGYSYGMYPHNILLEAAIVWGVPLVLFVISLFALGFAKSGRGKFLSWIGIFFVLLGMKSGDVLGSWFALSFIYFYAGVGLSALVGSSRLLRRRGGMRE